MSQFIEGNHKAFAVGAVLAQYLRVKLSTGKLVAAGLTDAELGVNTRATFSATTDPPVDVLLRTSNGTTPMVANGAIAAGAEVYSAASGKIGTTASGALKIGVCLDGASGDGAVCEVLRRSYEA